MQVLQHSIHIRVLCTSVCLTFLKPNQAQFINQICNLFIQIRRAETFSTKIRQKFDKMSNFIKIKKLCLVLNFVWILSTFCPKSISLWVLVLSWVELKARRR